MRMAKHQSFKSQLQMITVCLMHGGVNLIAHSIYHLLLDHQLSILWVLLLVSLPLILHISLILGKLHQDTCHPLIIKSMNLQEQQITHPVRSALPTKHWILQLIIWVILTKWIRLFYKEILYKVLEKWIRKKKRLTTITTPNMMTNFEPKNTMILLNIYFLYFLNKVYLNK